MSKKSSYAIPKSLYEKALSELSITYERDINAVNMRARCHQNTYRNFNSSEIPNCPANFLEAAKQALEDRNFKILYEIILKSLEVRNTFLDQQMIEYFFIAISHDPIIDRDRETKRFLMLVKNSKDPLEYLEKAYSFHQSERVDDDEDNLSEASFDLKLLQPVDEKLQMEIDSD